MKITILVNGERREVSPPQTLAALRELNDEPLDGVAVAINGAVVPRTKWLERQVHDGDDIEIVRAVQGG